MTTEKMQQFISPFSVSHELTINWSTISSKEQPKRSGMVNVSEKMLNLIDDLSVVGAIGSSQSKHLYLGNNAGKRTSKALDLGILKKHEFTKGNQIIPIYTLGSTGLHLAGLDYKEEMNYWKKYSSVDLLQRLVFFQLYGKIKEFANFKIQPSENPFVAQLVYKHKPNETVLDFHVLVLRGNEALVQNYFKYEMNVPERIIIVTESLNHLKPIEQYIKPFTDNIRVTTDERLKLPFDEMFYLNVNNEWVLECEINE